MSERDFLEQRLSSLRETCPCRFCQLPVDIQGLLCKNLSTTTFSALRPISQCWATRYKLYGPGKGSSILVIGGNDSSDKTQSDVFSLDCFQGEWTTLSPLAEPRHNHAAAVLHGLVYVAGTHETAVRFDPARNAWENIAPPRGFHKNAPAMTATRSQVHIIGGYTLDVESYDPGADAWIPGPDISISWGFFAPAAVSIGESVYCLGGRAGSNPTDLLHQWDVRTPDWQTLPRMQVKRDHLGAAVLGDHSIYAIGGYGRPSNQSSDLISLSSVERFDVCAGRWAPCAPMCLARAGLGAVALDDRTLAVMGGYDHTTPKAGPIQAVESYNAALDEWHDGPPMPAGRKWMAAVAV